MTTTKPHKADWFTIPEDITHTHIKCTLCPHECTLKDNERGRCRTRIAYKNSIHEIELYTLAYANPCSVNIDPIEKKPLYHFLPGSQILSIATAGCNLRCLNCQNWEISQSSPDKTSNYDLPPDKVLSTAIQNHTPSIAYTYTEPIVYYEYMYDTAQLAKQHNIKNVLISAGFGNREPIKKLCNVIDAANIDIKGFTDSFYKRVSGVTLSPILEAVQILKSAGVWIEITHLIVPNLSDDKSHIKGIANWIASNLSTDTPLHISRFHPANKLSQSQSTSLDTIFQAKDIAHEAGLKFVYLGNVGNEQNTKCPSCGTILVKRLGYHIDLNNIIDNKCPCGQPIAGCWT